MGEQGSVTNAPMRVAERKALMVAVKRCPDVRQWSPLLLGLIPEEEAEPLEDHLSSCDDCLH